MTPVNSTTVLISWSPPFTLGGTRPGLQCHHHQHRTTSEENETLLVEDTTLLYSIDHPDPGNSFTVTVVLINEVRAGEPAKPYVQSTQIIFFYTKMSWYRFNIIIKYFPRNFFTCRENLSWYSLNNKITIIETFYLLKFVALSTKTSSTEESQLQISDTGDSTQYTLLRQEIMLHSIMCYHNNAFSIANSTDNHNSVYKLLLYL